jgi:hypothetical protein
MSFSTANKVKYLFEDSLASTDSGSTAVAIATGSPGYIDVVDGRQLGARALKLEAPSYATLPSDMSHLASTDGYTASFWVKSDVSQSGQGAGGYAMEGMFLTSGAGGSGYNFSFHNAAGTFLDWGMGAFSGEGRLQTWNAGLTTAWKHIAFVVAKGTAAEGAANPSGDDALMRIYENGALVASQSPKSDWQTYVAFNPQNADLSSWNIGRGFIGDIDAFEVYDAPAATSDIAALYSQALVARTDLSIIDVAEASWSSASARTIQYKVSSTQSADVTSPFAVAIINDSDQLLYNGSNPYAVISGGSSFSFTSDGNGNYVSYDQSYGSSNKWGSNSGPAMDPTSDTYSLYWTDNPSFILPGGSQSTLAPNFTAADGTLMGSVTWDGSSFSFAAAGSNPYTGLVAGDYPLADIMEALHLDNDGSYLDKVALTQIKSRLSSQQPMGYVPRTVSTGLLAEEFIKGLKSMSILAAKTAGHISADEYALMTQSAASGGFGMATSDLVPEVPMVMMLDSYRSQISRLFDRDETMAWDIAAQSAIMIAKSSQALSTGHSGGTLLSAGDLKVASKLMVAASLLVAVDMNVTAISWDAALAANLRTQAQFDAYVAVGGQLGSDTVDDLVHLKVDADATTQGDLTVQLSSTFGDAVTNKANAALAADLVDMNSTLEVMTTSELHKAVHAYSTMTVQDGSANFTATNAYATNVGGDIEIGLSASPTNALHLDVNATAGDNHLDNKATFDVDLKVEGLFDADGAAAFDGATFDTFSTVASAPVSFYSADADTGATPSVSIKAEKADGSGGTVKLQTLDASKKIHFSSAAVGAKTVITGAADITSTFEVGTTSQLGNVDASKTDADLAADLVDINAALSVTGQTSMTEKVDADSTLAITNQVTIKDLNSVGSVLDIDLTVGAHSSAAKSDLGAAATAGVNAAAGLSQTSIQGGIKVGDLGSEVAITMDDTPTATGTYHDSRTIVDGISLNATDLAVIRSNDASNPDSDDIDVHIWASDAAGSIKLKGHAGIEVIGDNNPGSSAGIVFDDQVDIKGNLTIEVDSTSAGPAMKMVSGNVNKMTMTVNTSGATPKVDTVINNSVASGVPQGGLLSIDGSLTVTGALLTPSSELNIQAQTEVKIFDNIFELSYESEFLSFEDAIAFQATHNAFTVLEIKAAALLASSSDASTYEELTSAEKAASTETTNVEIRRDSNAGLYIPRTSVNPDGLQFWLQASGDSHADDADFLARHINQGERHMVVAPGNASPTDVNDDTVMGIAGGGSYIDMQAGSTFLEGSVVQSSYGAPLPWWSVLLGASRLSATEYGSIRMAWNLAQARANPSWVAMTEAEIDENILKASGHSGATPSRDETILMAGDYNGPLFAALQYQLVIMENADMDLLMSEKALDGSGKLQIQNTGTASASRVMFGTAPTLSVGGTGGSVQSEFGNILNAGTDSSTQDIVTFKDPSPSPSAADIILDAAQSLSWAADADGRAAYSAGMGTLRSDTIVHSMDARAHDLLAKGQAEASTDFQVKSLLGEAVGLGAASSPVTSFGSLQVDEKAEVKVDLMVGAEGAALTRGLVYNDDAPVIPALRLASNIDGGSSRAIYASAEAEFQLNQRTDGAGNASPADVLFGGDLAMAGSTRDRLVAENSIWFGEQLHKDMLKSSKDELRLQDKFTDGTVQTIGGVANVSFKDISQANVAVHGYTFAADSATVEALIRSGVDVLHELTMQEADDAGMLPASGSGSLSAHISGGGLASDASGKSFVNLMKSISAAMNASAGMSHEERISSFYAPNAPIAISQAFHALPIGSGTEGDVASGALVDTTKKRLEIYLNGQRIPDSEYDLILSASHPGKKIAFRKALERRDILVIESKVANPG